MATRPVLKARPLILSWPADSWLAGPADSHADSWPADIEADMAGWADRPFLSAFHTGLLPDELGWADAIATAELAESL